MADIGKRSPSLRVCPLASVSWRGHRGRCTRASTGHAFLEFTDVHLDTHAPCSPCSLFSIHLVHLALGIPRPIPPTCSNGLGGHLQLHEQPQTNPIPPLTFIMAIWTSVISVAPPANICHSFLKFWLSDGSHLTHLENHRNRTSTLSLS